MYGHFCQIASTLCFDIKLNVNEVFVMWHQCFNNKGEHYIHDVIKEEGSICSMQNLGQVFRYNVHSGLLLALPIGLS